MKRVLSLVFAVAVALAGAAWGYGSYVSKIPNGGVYGCNNCHDVGGNPFKTAFANNGHKWDAALAAKDSDGDGGTNGVELQDPDGNWKEGNPDPHVTGWGTYNPNDGGSTPPYAPVAPSSFGRVKAMFK